MANTIIFLGKEFEIPGNQEYTTNPLWDIDSYFIMIDSIENAYISFMDEFDKRNESVMKEEKKHGNKGFFIQDEFYNEYIGKECSAINDHLYKIEQLAYDVSPTMDRTEKYSTETKAYRSIKRLGDDLADIARNLLVYKKQSIATAERNAYRDAASNIKGLNYGIITSNPVDLMIYGAISNATLKRQAKKAEEQYEKELKKAADNTYSIYSSELYDLYLKIYIPRMREYMVQWANEVYEKALDFNIKYDSPFFAEMAKIYDKNEADKILENINNDNVSVELAIKTLQSAFSKCPYDKNIYIRTAQLGLMDKQILHMSKYFNCYEEVKNEVVNYCKKHLSSKKKIDSQCDLLVDKDFGYAATKKDALIKLYDGKLDKIESAYKTIQGAINNNNLLVSFVKYDLSYKDDVNRFVNNKTETINGKIKKYVNKTCDASIVQYLVDEDVIKGNSLSENNYTDIITLNEEYISELSKRVIKYQEIMKEKYDDYIKEKTLFDQELELMNQELHDLERENQSTFVFMFRKKSEIKNKITEKKSEIEKKQSQMNTFDWCGF